MLKSTSWRSGMDAIVTWYFKANHYNTASIHQYWLIDYLLFCVTLQNLSFNWRRYHYLWKAAKFKPTLGAQDLWAGRDLYRVTPAVTRGLDFFGLIQKTAPFSHLLRHARCCWGLLLTRILTCPHSVAPCYTQGYAQGLF
jgi:hypothetical protein